MRLLVTGGAGFIGAHFIRHLLGLPSGERPARIVNLDKLTYAANPEQPAAPEYRFVQGDVADLEQVGALLREEQITAVIHFAAESHVDRSIDSPEAFVQTNAVGTFRLLEAARHYWRKMEGADRASFRFLHVSTDEVYGSLAADAPAWTEGTPHAPNSPYAASKAAADHFVHAYHHTYGLPTVTTHCSNNYGPAQFPEKLIPLMIENALALRPLPVYGDGRQVRDWLYVTDHCRALWRVLCAGRTGETYHIGGGTEIANIDLVRTLCGLLDARRPRPGGSYSALIEFVADRPGHDRRYALDCGKIERELGWRPEETFLTGLEKTVDWYLDHPAWCARIRDNVYAQQRLGLPS